MSDDINGMLVLIISLLFLSLCCLVMFVGVMECTRAKQMYTDVKDALVDVANQAAEKAPLVCKEIVVDGQVMSNPNEQLIGTHNARFHQALLCGAHLAAAIYDQDAKIWDRMAYVFSKSHKPTDVEWRTYETERGAPADCTRFFCGYSSDSMGCVAEMVVVIRGTASTADAISDAKAFPVGLNGEEGAKENLWGKPISNEDAENIELHDGFHDRAVDMVLKFTEFLGKTKFSASSRVIVVGHSLGGAVATLFGLALAWRYHDQFGNDSSTRKVWVCTFGAPRCFVHSMERPIRKEYNDRDAERLDHAENVKKFETALDKFLRKPEFANVVKITRVKAHGDPVTNVPFATMGNLLCRHVTPYALVLERDNEKRGAAPNASNLAKLVLRVSIEDDEAHARDFVKKWRAMAEESTADGVFSAIQYAVNAPNHKMDSYKSRLLQVVGTDLQDSDGMWLDGVELQPFVWARCMLHDECWWDSTMTEDKVDATEVPYGVWSWTKRQLSKIHALGTEAVYTAHKIKRQIDEVTVNRVYRIAMTAKKINLDNRRD